MPLIYHDLGFGVTIGSETDPCGVEGKDDTQSDCVGADSWSRLSAKGLVGVSRLLSERLVVRRLSYEVRGKQRF